MGLRGRHDIGFCLPVDMGHFAWRPSLSEFERICQPYAESLSKKPWTRHESRGLTAPFRAVI